MLLFSISVALTWTQEPAKPTKIVEDGVNNKNVILVWKYSPDAGENIVGLEFTREDLDGRNSVVVSSRPEKSAFEAKNNFGGYCRGEFPSQLKIFSVDNVKEYKFSLKITIIKGSSLETPVSSVVVKVFGKYNYYFQLKLSFFLLGVGCLMAACLRLFYALQL